MIDFDVSSNVFTCLGTGNCENLDNESKFAVLYLGRGVDVLEKI